MGASESRPPSSLPPGREPASPCMPRGADTCFIDGNDSDNEEGKAPPVPPPVPSQLPPGVGADMRDAIRAARELALTARQRGQGSGRVKRSPPPPRGAPDITCRRVFDTMRRRPGRDVYGMATTPEGVAAAVKRLREIPDPTYAMAGDPVSRALRPAPPQPWTDRHMTPNCVFTGMFESVAAVAASMDALHIAKHVPTAVRDAASNAFVTLARDICVPFEVAIDARQLLDRVTSVVQPLSDHAHTVAAAACFMTALTMEGWGTKVSTGAWDRFQRKVGAVSLAAARPGNVDVMRALGMKTLSFTVLDATMMICAIARWCHKACNRTVHDAAEFTARAIAVCGFHILRWSLFSPLDVGVSIALVAYDAQGCTCVLLDMQTCLSAMSLSLSVIAIVQGDAQAILKDVQGRSDITLPRPLLPFPLPSLPPPKSSVPDNSDSHSCYSARRTGGGRGGGGGTARRDAGGAFSPDPYTATHAADPGPSAPKPHAMSGHRVRNAMPTLSPISSVVIHRTPASSGSSGRRPLVATHTRTVWWMAQPRDRGCATSSTSHALSCSTNATHVARNAVPMSSGGKPPSSTRRGAPGDTLSPRALSQSITATTRGAHDSSLGAMRNTNTPAPAAGAADAGAASVPKKGVITHRAPPVHGAGP